MYALSRGHSKLVASTRRGPATQLDNLEIKDTDREPGNDVIMSSPKPYFNHYAMMRRGGGYARSNNTNGAPADTTAHSQHEELVRFVWFSWTKVRTEVEMASRNSNQREGGTVIYKDKMHNPSLQGFQPFDLHDYWGKRTLQKITGSS